MKLHCACLQNTGEYYQLGFPQPRKHMDKTNRADKTMERIPKCLHLTASSSICCIHHVSIDLFSQPLVGPRVSLIHRFHCIGLHHLVML